MLSTTTAPMVTLPGNGGDIYGANYNRDHIAWHLSKNPDGTTRYRFTVTRAPRANVAAAKVRRQAKRAERHDVAAEIAAWLAEHAEDVDVPELVDVEGLDFEPIARWAEDATEVRETAAIAEHSPFGDRLDHSDWAMLGFIVRERF